MIYTQHAFFGIIVMLAYTELCASQRRGTHGRRNRYRVQGRRRGPGGSRQSFFSNWWNDVLQSELESGITSDDSFQWSNENGIFTFSSSSSSSNSGGNFSSSSLFGSGNEDNLNPPDTRPWRGQGSFTGDLKLVCQNKKCSKGAVLIYNSEKKRWGKICGNDWTKAESDVVCKFLQFSDGAASARRVKTKSLAAAYRKLPIMLRTIDCEGDEDTLNECGGEVVSSANPCPTNYVAGVVCRGQKEETVASPTCEPHQELCANGQRCISSTYKCDDMSDCPWGTDEINCQGAIQECPSNQFMCRPGECIKSGFQCDGDNDCSNGKDEEDCEDHLSHFERTKNSKLRVSQHRYRSGWQNASPYWCAKKCREETTFRCQSFDYNKELRECDLASLGARDVGLVKNWRSRDYDYYELSALGDCRGFVCSDLCLSSNQLCDGRPDCPNRADEANCSDGSRSWEIRLTGGFTRVDGRVEVRSGSGDFGLICDLDWTMREANVACRQLGFRNGAQTTLSGMAYHAVNKRVVLSGLFCTGREQSLRECRHDPWGQVNCPLNHEAGVICRSNDRPAIPPSPTLTTTTRPDIVTTIPTAPRDDSSPRPAVCGMKPDTSNIARPRIVNGNNADPHEWPWQAGIWIFKQLICGGTLIGECWVLTAAHCFNERIPLSVLTVRFGDHQSRKSDGTEQDFKIARLIKHSYDSRTHDNDIALLKLTPKNGRCATLNEYVSTACLPETELFTEGKQCHIVGWGQTQAGDNIPFASVLKEAVVPLIGRNTCRRRTEYGNGLTLNMICAGYLKGGIDTCQGDSGGPLLCENRGRYYIWGIVSWGNGCARPRAPGIYSKVLNYRRWIKSNTGI